MELWCQTCSRAKSSTRIRRGFRISFFGFPGAGVVSARGTLVVGLWAPRNKKTVSTRLLLVSQSVSKGLQRFPMKCCVYFQQDLVSIVKTIAPNCATMSEILHQLRSHREQSSSALLWGLDFAVGVFSVPFFLCGKYWWVKTPHTFANGLCFRVIAIRFTPSFALLELLECHNLLSF